MKLITDKKLSDATVTDFYHYTDLALRGNESHLKITLEHLKELAQELPENEKVNILYITYHYKDKNDFKHAPVLFVGESGIKMPLNNLGQNIDERCLHAIIKSQFYENERNYPEIETLENIAMSITTTMTFNQRLIQFDLTKEELIGTLRGNDLIEQMRKAIHAKDLNEELPINEVKNNRVKI